MCIKRKRIELHASKAHSNQTEATKAQPHQPDTLSNTTSLTLINTLPRTHTLFTDYTPTIIQGVEPLIANFHSQELDTTLSPLTSIKGNKEEYLYQPPLKKHNTTKTGR